MLTCAEVRHEQERLDLLIETHRAEPCTAGSRYLGAVAPSLARAAAAAAGMKGMKGKAVTAPTAVVAVTAITTMAVPAPAVIATVPMAASRLKPDRGQ
jgi:hypothetical protein